MSQVLTKYETVHLYDLPRSMDQLRIAHLSDLHLRRWCPLLEALQHRLVAEAYDLLLITGDFCDRPKDHTVGAELIRRLLDPVRPPQGIYGVLGNHDSGALAACDVPVHFLRNAVQPIAVGDREIRLVGVDQPFGHRSTLPEALQEFRRDATYIVLAHYPSTVYELPTASGALMLAGHTHGGQIRLPGVGCLWSHDGIPAGMARGLHLVRGNWLHVSPGVGTSPPVRLRMFCPPELTILTLRAGARRRSRRKPRSSGDRRHRSAGRTNKSPELVPA